MAVKIRLSKVGRKHLPIYRIVAVDSRAKRDGKCLDCIGTYNSLKHEMVQFKEDRLNYWVSQGAITTDSVKKIYKSYKQNLSKAKS